MFGPRQASYGSAKSNMTRTANLINGYFAAKGTEFRVTASDIPIITILLKVARLIETPGHRDSITDTAGYAQVLALTEGLDE